MTAPDFPAAHSMDTVWYAVDDAGHVAALYTGENGSVPTGVSNIGLLDELYREAAGPAAVEYPDWDDVARAIGVYLYRYSDGNTEGWPVEVYQREVSAPRPLHVDQLPPHLRAECKRFRFPGVRFSEVGVLQPFEYFQCQAYEVGAEAYLASDGVTVRPIPGREDVWAEFVEDLRAREPEAAARYRFEGPTDVR